MKILHTGDLHLDSPFCSENIHGTEMRREAQRKCFCRIMKLAKDEGCDMILISGDLFDSGYVSRTTEELVIKAFSEAKCPIIISPGNHDPYIDGSFYKRGKLPENVYVFTSNELQVFDFDELGVSVWGYAFTSNTIRDNPLLDRSQKKDTSNISILCAHGDLSSPISRFAPLTVGDIRDWGFTYTALGHIHNPILEPYPDSDNIKYSGFPEGRSFDELGDGHVLIVDISDEVANAVKHKVSETKYEIAYLDISETATREELTELIRTATSGEKFGRGTNLRLCLTGFSSPDILGDTSELEKDCIMENETLSIEDHTLQTLNEKDLRADITLRGEFYRRLLPKLSEGSPEDRHRALLALQIGLAVIDGKDPMKGRSI